MVADPELERDRIVAETMESALLASIQQQASDPNGPYQPDDLAYLTKLVLVENAPIYDAVERTQKRAQERQATPAPAPEMLGGMPPEAMPGLAMPGMGAEQPAPQGAGGLEGLLAQLGKAAEQRRAQQAMPIGASPADVTPSQGVAPGGLGAFNRPTDRATEPITAGVNFGDGLNAIQAGVNQPIRTEDAVLDRLKVIFEQYPNDELADLLDSYIRDGY